jgi:hypothetical protein
MHKPERGCGRRIKVARGTGGAALTGDSFTQAAPGAQPLPLQRLRQAKAPVPGMTHRQVRVHVASRWW